MDEIDWFKSWALGADAAPLLVTGSASSLERAAAQVRSLFSAADVYELGPTGSVLKIADIRQVRKLSSQRAWSGRRLVIIHQAETLGEAAANALLLTLEDAGKSTRFVLTTTWPNRLLPTIRSRCAQRRVGYEERSKTATGRSWRLAADEPLEAATLEAMAAALERHLREKGPSRALRGAYLRLKDYYLVASLPGGNQKLARDALLAYIADIV